jgi:hypothetical protein
MRTGSDFSCGRPPAPDRAEAVAVSLKSCYLLTQSRGSDVTDTILCTFSSLLIYIPIEFARSRPEQAIKAHVLTGKVLTGE